ncbi:glycosyltransferase family 4 protein [Flavobacterium sp. MC2016-06]|jgi:glycosyltransferase involved in cell wall biosynthesis|uniref:glycosyltransferase family 4 protein n=1 Tax=Flavobacterium sp. MC2016-06 TaxID=2676308 RepID=UPI0012BA7643|nr:glycosyltransferase family 4 protein [Flavobacterium sp. MC2016-06]MBU3858670.1 glycosyltransferase family 4 protein [Flavobacterium sp. MC2016-06]
MPKVILISQTPLPYSKIGSWTTLYKNYLESNHKIDYVICNKPQLPLESVKYRFVINSFKDKLIKKWTKNPYYGYLKALDEIIKPDEKYIIQIIDNYGIVKLLIEFLEKKGKRNQCYIQFFYHGFAPFYENFRGQWFFQSIDEMILLTNDSYLEHKKYYTVLPTRFSVLHNGIDTSKFHPVSIVEKELLKKDKDLLGKKIFVWCSQDRPKKGLHIILDAWKRLYEARQDIVLWVIGSEHKYVTDGVEYLGQIPNDELPKYYQTADCYLFPTLCHEGFGMSLIEALHCGNYCIASAIGGVPEVLQYGKLGKLIEKPNFVSEWEKAILEFLNNGDNLSVLVPDDLYTTVKWNKGMNLIIDNATKNIS